MLVWKVMMHYKIGLKLVVVHHPVLFILGCHLSNISVLQRTPTKQSIVGAGFVGLDFGPYSVEVVLHILG